MEQDGARSSLDWPIDESVGQPKPRLRIAPNPVIGIDITAIEQHFKNTRKPSRAYLVQRECIYD